MRTSAADVKFISVHGAFGGLIATYQPEGSAGIGQLDVWASVPPFAGAARGYFNDDDLHHHQRPGHTNNPFQPR